MASKKEELQKYWEDESLSQSFLKGVAIDNPNINLSYTVVNW